MSLIHPVKKVYITQEWGVNQKNYAKFNLLGHNGVDYRAFLPDGQRCFVGEKSEVFAPHSGTVIENRHDAQGYGWYVKIENDKEGSILAHFSSQSLLKVNQHVNQGAFVGYQGTTGNSRGIHLHWGYYPKPRNKSNGYSGTINQLPLLGEKEHMTATKELDVCMADRKKFWEERDEIFRELNTDSVQGAKNAIAGLRSRITDLGNQLGSAQAEAENRKEQVSRQESQLLILKDDLLSEQIKLKDALNQADVFAKEKGRLAIEVKQLQTQIESLKQGATQAGITLTIREIFQLIWNQKIQIKIK